MHRFVLSLLLAFSFTFPGLAQQIRNGGLEVWTLGAGGPRASSWLNTDDVLARKLGVSLISGTLDLTTDQHSGTFAARMVSQTVPFLGTLPGCLILGSDMRSLSNAIPGGIPFTDRAVAMELYYKLSGANLAADSATAKVFLTRTQGGQRQLVAAGSLVLPAAAAYSLATIPLQYSSVLAPDSIHIILSSGMGRVLTAGTTLYVDDVVMTAVIAATRPAGALTNPVLYPNPAAHTATLSGTAPGAVVQVYDVRGNRILVTSANGAGTANLTLRSGLYVVRSEAGQALRLVVE